VTGSTELRHMQLYVEICKVCYLNNRITSRINLAMFHEMLPMLYKQYSVKQMVSFTCAHQHEDCRHNDELPLPLISPIEFDIDDTEAEYQGIGVRVELSTFCNPVESAPKSTSCSVCVTEIDGAEQEEDEKPVLTKCGHMFHQTCLDKWVNDSGMKASNTCPSCRAMLCEPRERLHAYVEVISIDCPYVEGDTLSMGSRSFELSDSDAVMPPYESV
jgi:hypothetical protein